MFPYSNETLVVEIITRLILWMVFIYMELCQPFIRVIQPEEIWLYKYPHTQQYVPGNVLWLIVILIPTVILTMDFLKTRNRIIYKNGILCLSLLLGLNGLITIILKLIVGRPRPDFYARCFPDGIGDENLECTGNEQFVLEGRKSFPSGHASFSFASMVFVSLFLSERMKLFQQNRGQAWRLICCILPLLFATAIAVSRTCDYHHHWQDVTVGGMLGSMLAYVCYKQYFPLTIMSNVNHTPHYSHSTSNSN